MQKEEYFKRERFKVIKWKVRKRTLEELGDPDKTREHPTLIKLRQLDFSGTIFRRTGIINRILGPRYSLRNVVPDEILVYGNDLSNPSSNLQLVSHYDSMARAYQEGRDEFECKTL